ncbi:hypothetical protein KM043_001419 [Ampulex compressa]|nr:hypothetical protein KM043_001419 [Ampulex compressa]
MKRSLRNKNWIPVIIESSDNDDEDRENSSDGGSCVPVRSNAKGKVKKRRISNKDDKQNKQNFRVELIKEDSNVMEEISVKSEERKVDKSGDTKRKRNVNDVSVPKKRQRTSITSMVGKVNEEWDSKNVKVDTENQEVKFKNNHRIGFDVDSHSGECVEWTEAEYVSEVNNVDKQTVENVIKLFNDENTIPFIARYRKNITSGMEADQLRMLKESLDQAKLIKHRAATILKTIDKLGKWTPQVHTIVKSTKSLSDLEHIYSLYKPASKRSLAERARDLGLGPLSDSILQGQRLPPLTSLIDSNKGLQTEEQVKDGVIHIIADVINKNKTIFDKVKTLQKTAFIEIHTSQCKANDSSKDKKKDSDEIKYKMYYDFTISVRNIKPHHILAINRGESQKILNVKLLVPDSLERSFKKHCLEEFRNAATASKMHLTLLNDSIDYAYKKFVKPLVVRRVRSEMKERAEAASIEVFVTNVKQLLLSPPIRGKVVLGVDPGFYHGCKLAVVSEQGNVLDTSVIYPHKKSELSYKESVNVLVDLAKRHGATLIALGNATACRETELFLSGLIKSGAFGTMNVSYTIVDEAGASIYSCSAEAKSEFPDMDPNLISAISIARRLQDPLAELVKVEPKHLGVGMYQHDLPEKQLSMSLNEVVTEAVSFVGVDVNTASLCLLKRVAGLNASRASKIIEWRIQKGPFKNREQLLDVKGIGGKTFEQCAGFIRILPETAISAESEKKVKGSKASKNILNPLDQTWIHPESYKLTKEFLKGCKCSLEDLGSPAFIEKIKSYVQCGYAALADKLSTNETTMAIVVKGLTMRKDEEIRLKGNHPLFRNSMLCIDDLQPGTTLTGAVRNITHFGAFVDVGVGRDGLVHTKWIKNETLSIGQRVEVKVLSIERERSRIGLELIKVI